MGHINTDNKFGFLLTKLGADAQFTTYLEVGTWNGQGSTRCLMYGIQNNPNPKVKLYSLEANLEMYQKAISFWGKGRPQLELLYGTLHKTIMPLSDVESNPMFYKYLASGDKYKQWHHEEQVSVFSSDIIVIPETQIDVVVIDGGEYSADGDWEVLQTKNPKVVCLDDCQVVKAYHLRNRLIASNEWDIVIDEIDDRNGWIILKRKDVNLEDDFVPK